MISSFIVMLVLQQLPELPDGVAEAIGGLTATGTLIFGAIKWWENRRDKKGEIKVSREEWLIENAFDVAEGLRVEITRLRVSIAEERVEHARRMRELEADHTRAMNEVQRQLSDALVKVSELQQALLNKGD